MTALPFRSHRRRALRSSLVVLAIAIAGCGEDGPPTPRKADRITVATGDNQEAQVGLELALPVTFTVGDKQGPMAGVAVTFTLSDQSGFLSVPSATSDANGVVSVRWTVGGALGTQTLTASGTGLTSAAAKATVREGAVALLTPLSASSQFVLIGGLVPSPPQVRVTDAFGNPLANQTVSFVDGSNRSTVVGGTVTSDGAGRAGVVSWKIGRDPGSYSLQATAGAGATANFVAFGIPSLVQIAGGEAQSANAGTRTAQPPAVRAFDDQQQPLGGVPVVFRVTGGGGRLLGAGTAQTAANGIATAPAWVLGATPGANELVADISGVPPLTFHATGVAAVPVAIATVGAGSQSGLVGNFAAARPTIRISDAQANPVAGTPVTFAITAGGGSVAGATPVTDLNGEASLGAWRFGTGAQTLTATVGSLAPVTFTATTQSPPPGGYQIEVRFIGPAPSATQRTAFEDAAARWSGLILGDLDDVPFTSQDDLSFCGGQSLNESVDDLLVFAKIDKIDGPGNVLGQAGVCYIRDDNLLSVVGIMQFDVDDVVALEASGRFRDVVLHEMAHVVGLGSLWNVLGLITGRATGDPFFSGASARMAFAAAAASPTAYLGNAVPVENSGGGGTRDVHWRESVVTNELMTGFLNTGSNPLSAITVASFRDEGYLVNDAASDPFAFGAALRAAASAPMSLHVTEWTEPIRTIDRAGRVRRALDPRAGPFRR